MKLYLSPEFLSDLAELNRHLEKTGTPPATAISVHVLGENDDGSTFRKEATCSQSVADGMVTVEFSA